MTGDTGRERLGAKLRQIRERAKKTLNQIPNVVTGRPFGSSQLSPIENGKHRTSDNVINGYARIGGNRAELLALRDAAEAEIEAAKSKNRQAHAAAVTKNCEEPPYVPEAISGRYTIQSSEHTFSVNAEGVLEELRVVITTRSIVPNARLFFCKHAYRADRRRGVLQIEPGAGCQIEQVEESDTGAVRAYLKLDETIGPDDLEPYRFSYRVRVDSSVPCEPVLLLQATSKTMEHVVKVQFHERSAPERIWWVEVPSEMDAEYDPIPEQILKPDPANFYFKSFSVLADAWSYGLCWNKKATS